MTALATTSTGWCYRGKLLLALEDTRAEVAAECGPAAADALCAIAAERSLGRPWMTIETAELAEAMRLAGLGGQRGRSVLEAAFNAVVASPLGATLDTGSVLRVLHDAGAAL